MAVGVFDSGLGGLTVLDAVAKRLPDVPFVYFGDTAHTPYGVRDHEDIYTLTTQATNRLFAAGCDLVILACNTASAVALRRMQESWLPVASRALQRELAFRAIGVDVEAQACGGVVDAIEEVDMILAEAVVRSQGEALQRKMPKPDAAILGSTHYPIMKEAFQAALGPDEKVLPGPSGR